MITTMYYYNYYKPYMFKPKKSEKPVNQVNKLENRSYEPMPETKRLLLNKTLNKDVVNYAHNVSSNLTSLKDAAKYINYDIDDYKANENKYGYDKTRNMLKSDIENFVSAYNKAYNFYSSQKHSQSLVDFSIDIDNTIIMNSDYLSNLGVNIKDNSLVEFSADKFDQLNNEELVSSMSDSKHIFDSLYNQSSSMLSLPLTEHMNFKNLNYYYNYKFGGLVSDTFKVIESGLIIDKVV